MCKFLGFFLSIFFVCSFSFFTCASLDLSEAGTLTFAKRIIATYPEAEWLMGEGVKGTLQGEKGTPLTSWSLQIRGKHYIEFERTVSSMLILYAFNQGDEKAYEWFTRYQKESDRLSKNSFNQAATLVQKVVKEYSLKLLETNLLLGDLGKTPEAHKLAKEYGITEGDHDIFLAQCLERCPNIFPTYKTLTKAEQKTIRSNAGLLHFGHLMHMEGTATAMLSTLKKSEMLKQADGFDFELVCHLCDISAVLAHVNNQGSLVMIEPLYQSILDAMEVVSALSTKTEGQALLEYTERRCKRLLWWDITFPTRDILARIAAMMRLTTPNDGQLLRDAWQKMPNPQNLIDILHPFRTDQKIPTPTYVPAVLTNLRDSLSKIEPDPQKVMDVVIEIALPWIVNVIQTYEKEMGSLYPPNLTLNFNAIGGAVRDNPHVLDKNPGFSIDKETGEVTLLLS